MKSLFLLTARLVTALFLLIAGNVNAASTMLYVAGGGFNGTGTATAYDPSTNGNVTPLLTVNQSPEVFSLAFDQANRLYTMGYMGSADIKVYPANSVGFPAPYWNAFGIENDATGIAVDSKGYFYQITGSFAGGTRLNAFAPFATTPYLSIPLTFLADGITVDADDNVIVTAWDRTDASFNFLPPDQRTAIIVYPPQLSSTTPIRIISGSNTGLTRPINQFETGFKVAYSKLSGRIYAGLNSKVLVFDAHANGNTAPLRTISGAATGLRTFIHGIAGNPVTGEIFVLSRDISNGVPSGSSITVYAQLANGNAAPLRTLTGGFDDSSDIAFTSPATVSINAGGAAATNFTADSNFTGGSIVSWTNNVDTSALIGITPAQSVLRSDREGNFTYKFTGFTPDSYHTVTFYFVENYFTAPGKRVFTIYANGVAVVYNLDIFAEAGARFKAIQHSMIIPANGNGEFLIQQLPSKDQSKVGAIVIN